MTHEERNHYKIAIWVLVLVVAPTTTAVGVAAASGSTGNPSATPASMGAAATTGGGPTIAGAAAAGGATTSTGAAAMPADTETAMYTPEGEAIVVEHSYERATDEGRFRVTVTIDASRVTDVGSYGGYLVAVPDESTVISTANLSSTRWSGYDFQAAGNTDVATLRYSVPARQTAECSDDASAYTSTDEGSWAFTSRYDTGATIVQLYQGQSPPDIDVEHDIAVDGLGYGGNGFGYMGAAETVERSFDGQDVTLVVPNAAADSVNVDGVMGSFRSASADFDVGKRSDEFVVFAAPSPIRQGGAAVGRWNEHTMDAWVSADADLQSVGNAWIHEYVHTRQAYDADFSMDGSGTNTSFLVEGGAEYYAALLSLQAGNATFEEFYADVNTTQGADAILGDQPAFGCNGYARYTKGSRVVAALDAKIRNETGGAKSFEDVFRKMNADPDGTVTYEEFKDYVEQTAGRSYDDWIDKHVQTRAVPSIPETPFAFTSEGADDDDDGLATATEKQAGTDPFDADSDADALEDGVEVNEYGSDPTVKDSDDDGIPDGLEVENEMDPTSTDSDGDGISDEVEWDSESLDATAADTDGDGVDDDREGELGTDPDVADTDGDELDDGEELDAGTDPTVADTDDDGLDDGDEIAEGTDPTVADSDADGLEDGAEVFRYSTDPSVKDSDGDGVTDGREVVEYDTDPTDADDHLDDEATTGSDETETGDDGIDADDADQVAGGQENEVVGPETVPGFSATTALLALLAGFLLVARARFD